MKYEAHAYQEYATQRIIDTPKVGLFLDMGLGKTVSTLTAVEELIHDRFAVRKCLVIAPLRVAKMTWTDEAAKWDHLHLRISRVLGSEAERKRALSTNADVYTINRENVPWLVKLYGRRWPFDMVVVDESSSFKNHRAKRFRALRQVLGLIDRLVLLTGTPSPRSLMDLWAQMYLLDQGARLGKTIGAYRDAYFKPGKRNGYVVYDWILRDGADEAIYRHIGDVCVSMTADDWLTLPERVINRVEVELPPAARRAYDRLLRDFVAEIDGNEVTAANAAVLTGKLLQVANGAVYDEDGAVREVHRAKLDALAEIREECNEPMIVFYWYQHDAERLQKAFPDARFLETEADLAAWNRGEIPMLLLHPASAGHGLNLQEGGHVIVWYGLTWSLELYQQANARLYRQGQTKPVIVHHLVAKNTMDGRVLNALAGKSTGQDALIAAVKAEIGA